MISIAGCEIRVTKVTPKKGYTVVAISVKAPTRSYQVEYQVDDKTGEVLLTDPYTLHREMKAVHAAWREEGIMTKKLVTLNWYQRLRGVDPQTSYRRFFARRWWEENQ